ncbi:hypothetical protein [Bradyrhizobium sp. URHD0069]|uniref:hypothetical protein n=1 Tax=Bradyrhizobium sp. URHD0069 TaxID=1380355 RepID=UPI00068FE9B4|nr:hypothetical protein [Bradyrhizobium sp. URHD0069]
MQKEQKELVLAYHEAGHAVIAHALGIAVKYVTTLEDASAALTHSATYLARDADHPAQLEAIRKDVIVCLAGPHSQAKHRRPKKKEPDEWKDDIETASGLAARAGLVATGIDLRRLDENFECCLTAYQAEFAADLFQHCSEKARNLVDEHWTAIDTVAKALLSRPVLNGDDIAELIGRSSSRANGKTPDPARFLPDQR